MAHRVRLYILISSAAFASCGGRAALDGAAAGRASAGGVGGRPDVVSMVPAGGATAARGGSANGGDTARGGATGALAGTGSRTIDPPAEGGASSEGGATSESGGQAGADSSQLDGDANGDGCVNVPDYLLVLKNYMKPVPPADARADLNRDGTVDDDDVRIVVANLGRCH